MDYLRYPVQPEKSIVVQLEAFVGPFHVVIIFLHFGLASGSFKVIQFIPEGTHSCVCPLQFLTCYYSSH